MAKKGLQKAFHLPIIAILVLLCFFISQRIFPLLSHNVAYTYDQGRDFLKAAELVDEKNLTFIGPTTGINGLYHGAWWYYILSAVYALTSGVPITFYFSNFILHLFTFLVLMIFILLEFGLLMMLLVGLIVVSAPYFIGTSLFVGNNIMAIPSMLGFLIVIYYVLKYKIVPWWVAFVLGISLGLVSEFELSFGLMLIPAFLITVVLFKALRQKLLIMPNILFWLCGLVTIFLPRLLFEVKNGFPQTNVLLSFFIKPKLHNPKPYLDIVVDRANLFRGYYHSLFANDLIFSVLTFTGLCVLILSIYKKRTDLTLKVYSILLLILFIFSTLYKDNFWGNYYEGIQYLILLIIALVLRHLTEISKGKTIVAMICLLILGVVVIQTPKFEQNGTPRGMAAQEQVVDYLHKNGGEEFCLDVYTPPAIPYTYRYLFYYHSRQYGKPMPTSTWVNDRCWYILEADDNRERKESWIATRIPKEARRIRKHTIADIDIELWEK